MVISHKFLKARDAVLKARLALQEAERRFDRDHGMDPDATARLIAGIKAAEATLAGAAAAAKEEERLLWRHGAGACADIILSREKIHMADDKTKMDKRERNKVGR
jgi:hypothetical protein